MGVLLYGGAGLGKDDATPQCCSSYPPALSLLLPTIRCHVILTGKPVLTKHPPGPPLDAAAATAPVSADANEMGASPGPEETW
jgi:hypothetical protein